MEMTVWVDGWQMQCCGTPFSVGEQVSWTVREADSQWLTDVLGVETAAAVNAAEEHHADDPATCAVTAGKVTQIRTVHCRVAPTVDGRALYPVQGSAIIAPITSADGWSAEEDEHRFMGYLVGLAGSEAPAFS